MQKTDNVAVHWYGPANADDFKNHINKAISAAEDAKSRFWSSASRVTAKATTENKHFSRDVLPWLDSQGGVLSYAYFPTKDLIASGQVTTLGHLYMDL